eukprot:scaffold10115_cov95-Skeletonema_dohrnii-CCMP3373.AAC.8
MHYVQFIALNVLLPSPSRPTTISIDDWDGRSIGRLAGGGPAGGLLDRFMSSQSRVWWLGSGTYLPCSCFLYMSLDVQCAMYVGSIHHVVSGGGDR